MTEAVAPPPSTPPLPALSRHVVVRNTAAVMVARVVDIAAGLLTLRILAPYLGPAGFGDYAWAWAFVLALQPLVNFEMDRILIRESARSRESTLAFWGGALLVKGALVTLFVALVSAASMSLAVSADLRLALLLAGASEVCYHLHMLHSAVFQSRERMDADLGLMVMFRLLLLAGMVAGALLRMPLPFFFGAALTANACRAVVGGVVIGRRIGPPDFRQASASARKLLSLALPLTVSAVIAGLMLNAQIFILKALAAPEQVGYFQLAHPILMQLQIVPGALMTALFPGFSRTFTHAPERLSHFVRQAVPIFFLIAGVLALVLHGGAPLVVELLGAGKYGPAQPVLMLLALALPAVFGMTLLSFSLVAADGQRDLAKGTIWGLVANAGLGLLLVPRLGARGAALATVTAYYVLAAAYGALSVRRLPRALDPRQVLGMAATLAVTAATLVAARRALPLPAAAFAAVCVFGPLAGLMAREPLRALRGRPRPALP